MGKDEEYDAPYYIISGANKFFSSQKSEPADVIMGIDKLDDNNIIIYFHEYIPTDFLSVLIMTMMKNLM